jgi:hypothetical protein
VAGFEVSTEAEVFAAALKTVGRANATAVIDGFRVHPDFGADGLIHLTEGDGLVINGADIASRPPAPSSFLIVNWGDEGNERVACGACRLVHSYVAGRFTVTAAVDDLQPGTAKPSTTFTVDVAPAVAPVVTPAVAKAVSPFAGLAFQPTVLTVRSSGTLFVPVPPPGTDIFLDGIPVVVCTPFFPPPILLTALTVNPAGATLRVLGLRPGSCTVSVNSHDSAGNVFHDSASVSVVAR